MPNPATPLISSGVTTAGNLIGAGLNRIFGKDASKEQFEYNKKLIAEQYKYNNPQRQMADYRAAGINPYAALGNNTSVSGSSVGQAPTPDLSKLGSDAAAAYAQSYPLESEKDLRVAEAEERLSQERLNIASMSKVAAEAHSQKISNQILEDTMEDKKRLIRAEAKVAEADWAVKEQQATLYSLQSVAQHTTNEALPKILQQQISESIANIRLMYLQGKLTIAQAKQAVSAAALNAAEESNIRINNKYLHAIETDMIERYCKENELMREKLSSAIRDNDWGEVEKILNAASSTAGTFVGAVVGAAGAKTLVKGGSKIISGFN